MTSSPACDFAVAAPKQPERQSGASAAAYARHNEEYLGMAAACAAQGIKLCPWSSRPQVKSSQVKSSPACPKAASWRSRQRNTTLRLQMTIHGVSRCQTAVEHDITSSSESLRTQFNYEGLLCSTLYKIREGIACDSEKVAHALTPTVETTSNWDVGPRTSSSSWQMLWPLASGS